MHLLGTGIAPHFYSSCVRPGRAGCVEGIFYLGSRPPFLTKGITGEVALTRKTLSE